MIGPAQVPEGQDLHGATLTVEWVLQELHLTRRCQGPQYPGETEPHGVDGWLHSSGQEAGKASRPPLRKKTG